MNDWQNADWPDLTRRLLAYTAFLLGKSGMDPGPDGEIAQKYVEKVIVDFLDEYHAPEYGRSLFVKLAGMIRVAVVHDAERRRR